MPKELTIENISLPVGWEKKPLGEVCEINPKKSEVNSFPANHLVSFLPMKDLGVAQNQINPITIKQLSEVKGSYTYFRNNDVLLAKVTPCFENGKLGIAKNLKNEIGFGSSEYIVFRPNNEILSEYLFYILSSSKFRNRGKELMYGAVGLKRLSKDYVKNFITPFPSIDKQKQIVATLDKAFAAIDTAKANAEQNLQNAKELFESYLQNIFENKGNDWKEGEFGNVIITLTDYHANGSYKILKKNVELKDNDDYAWMIRSTDFENNFKNQFKYISENAYNFMSKSKVLGNEIIMSKIGNAGKVYLMPEIDRPTSLAMNLFLIRLDENKAIPEFVFHFLKSKRGESQIKKRVKGATTKTITKDNVRNIIISYPSIETQKGTVKKLDVLASEVKKLEVIYTQKIADLEEMKKSVLQKAFSGQLNTINESYE